jgi:phage baseplate assembly protein W
MVADSIRRTRTHQSLEMNIHGSSLSIPFAADQRGTLATVSARAELVAQSILSILSTRQGERVMLPDYGIPDYAFATADAGFVPRVAYLLRQQVLKYEPLVDELRVSAGGLDGDEFVPGLSLDAGRVALRVEFTVRGSKVPHSLVYPTWELRS